MSLFDIILLGIIGVFTLMGLWFGFVHTFGSLMGTLLGAYLASRYYEPLASWFVQITGWSINGARVIMFIVAFVVINRLVGFAFWIIDKVFSLVTHLPFIRSIDRLLGGALGFFEGIVTLGMVFYFMQRFPVSQSIMESVAQSVIAPKTVVVASILMPMLPEALKLLRSTIDFVEKKMI
jgi:membrane protein required for colicin V production